MHEIPPTHRVCRAVIHLHAVDLESKHRVGLLRELNMVALHELFAVLHPATEKKNCLVCQLLAAMSFAVL